MSKVVATSVIRGAHEIFKEASVFLDKAIKEKTSLRDIASQYRVSKSTVDRHKAHLGS